jgi:hypothetical protein
MPLKMQILEGAGLVHLLFGLLLVGFFLRRIHFMRGVRYPEHFKRDTDAKFRDTSNLNL